jgi:hypothetical protein
MSHRKSYWCAAAISNAFFAELPFQKQGLVRVRRSGMKKGRSEDERPKSREETPKWANGSLDRPAPPRYRDMSLFAVAINQPRGRRSVLPIECRLLAPLIDPRPHVINMQGVDKQLMPEMSLVLFGYDFAPSGAIL